MANVTASGGLNMRKAPKPGEVIKLLRKGTQVEVLGEETWLKVRTKGGAEGYVSADFIDDEPLLAAPVAVASEVAEPADHCDIARFTQSRFEGKPVFADKDFWPCLDRLNTFAEQCDVFIHVTSSAREPGRTVRGAIVKPASRSNHMIGHAIDMNVRSSSGFFNSKKLKKSRLLDLPHEVRQFIQRVRDDEEMRWGGDFSKEDTVHIDDGFNHRHPELWDMKLASR